MNPIRVLLIEDHTLVREGIRALLEQMPTIDVVGTAALAREGVEMAAKARPQVILLDYGLPDMGCAAAVRELLAAAPARIMVITGGDPLVRFDHALSAGAHGVALKMMTKDELEGAIQALHEHGSFMPEELRGLLEERGRTPRESASRIEQLSAREFEFLRLIAHGLGLRETAERMGVSSSAVSTYRTRALKKLGLKTTGELMRFAIDHELID